MEAITIVVIAVCGWIVIIFIAVLGWIATHILTIRAQNKALLNQVINEARLQITGAIREYQDCLGKVYSSISGLQGDLTIRQQGFSVDWDRKAAELGNLFLGDRGTAEWVRRLEEYEILFPKTAECRRELLDRQGLISKLLFSLSKELLSTNTERRRKAIADAEKKAEILTDQLALMEDLRVYLQNLCLSSFTGNRIPERKPEDPSLPRLVEDKDGDLRIVTIKKKKPTEAHNG